MLKIHEWYEREALLVYFCFATRFVIHIFQDNRKKGTATAEGMIQLKDYGGTADFWLIKIIVDNSI